MADGIAIVADFIATNHCKLYYSVADEISTSFLADVVTKYMMADVIHFTTSTHEKKHFFI